VTLYTSKSSPNTIEEVLNSQKPLVVDIDGTLASRDIFASSLIQLTMEKPWLVPRLIKILMGGGLSALKTELAESRKFDWDSHPKNEALIEILASQSTQGRQIFLCSGAAEKHVQTISDSLGYLTDSWGTTKFENLTGKTKALRLIDIFGDKGFDYIGDSHKDLHVSRVANRTAILRSDTSFASLLRQLRPTHWVKNLLVFVPLIAAHQITDPGKLSLAAIAFISLSLIASSTYIFNDLSDLAHDSIHKEKRTRPLASGEVKLGTGIVTLFSLVGASLVLSWNLLSTAATIGIAGYGALSVLYSLSIKRFLGMDVIFIALLFVYRVLLGFLVAELTVSPWLVMFAFFMFLSIAMSKRYSELMFSGQNKIQGRAYTSEDAIVIIQSGLISGFLATLVFGLYINSTQIMELYSRPEILWIGIPLLCFWILHLWMHTNRNRTGHDPLIWAVKDPWSLFVVTSALVIVYLAT
jgi:4-hydroxybenzoate polyprenyltransferase